MGDGVPARVTKLDSDNYMSWSKELEHIMRLRGCWSAVAPLPVAEAARSAAAADARGVAGTEPRVVTQAAAHRRRPEPLYFSACFPVFQRLFEMQ